MLAFATVGAAFNYWGAIRLRLAGNLTAMIGVQVLSTVVMLGLAVPLASHGTVWVAAAWGIGHFVGGVAGYVASVTVRAASRTTRPAAADPTPVEVP